jgi:pullulanase
VENSFESPDSINAIDWSLKSENKEMFEYIKALIKMRKEHPAFRMTSTIQIATNIEFFDFGPPDVVMFQINGAAVGDKWKSILICLNGNGKGKVDVMSGLWKPFIVNNKLTKEVNEKNKSTLPYSFSLYYQE